MSIQAANVAPSFHLRQRLAADDLMHLDEPCVLFEHHGHDSDGEAFFVYTVAGVLHGKRLEDGCTVGGEVIVIHAGNRADADAIASLGLQDTINALHKEAIQKRRAQGALARLGSISRKARLEAALKPTADKSDAFVADVEAIRPLIGDDIVLATGGRPDSLTH